MTKSKSKSTSKSKQSRSSTKTRSKPKGKSNARRKRDSDKRETPSRERTESSSETLSDSEDQPERSRTIMGMPTIKRQGMPSVDFLRVCKSQEHPHSHGLLNLNDGPVTIGRSEDATVTVTSNFVSYEHAEISKHADVTLLRDNSSSNGSRINGVYCKQGRLRPRDVIGIHNLLIECYSSDPDMDDLVCGIQSEDKFDEASTHRFVITAAHLLDSSASARSFHEHVGELLEQLPEIQRISSESRPDQLEIKVSFYDLTSLKMFSDNLRNLVPQLAYVPRPGADPDFVGVKISNPFQLSNRSPDTSRSESHHISLTSEGPLLSWIHLSDIHFGAGKKGYAADRRRVLGAIKDDIRNSGITPDRIIVTGDLTFSAQSSQFAEAMLWLKSVAEACNRDLSIVRLVPGNHDVNREVAGTLVCDALHQRIRQREQYIDDYISDQAAGTILRSKLQTFIEAVSTIPTHPALSDSCDWVETIDVRGQRIHLNGLCSVWTSDSNDGLGEGDEFVPNMTLSQVATAAIQSRSERGDINIVLTHHPYHWLSLQSRKWLEAAVRASSALHLCGHIHNENASAVHAAGAKSFVMINAGASHSDPKEPPRHSYSWGKVVPNENGYRVGWSPRTFVEDWSEMRLDSVRYELDSNGYAWVDIHVRQQTMSGIKAYKKM